jgi:WD40 repeat protein
MAVAASGSVYVSATRPSATGTDPYRAVLGGRSGPGVSGVAFLGGPDRLVTSSGSGVALWDLRQFQRVATRQSARVVPGCVACAGPLVATTDGSRVAFESDTFDSPVIHDLADGRELRWADSTYGPQLWDGERRLVLGFADGSVRTVDATTGQAGPAWPDPQPAAISYLRWVDDGSHVAVVDARGGLTVRDPDGTVVRRFAPPASIRNGYVASGYAAVDSHADHVAYRVTHGVMVVDTHSGRTVARVARKATAADLEFIGDRLLVSTFSADESGYDVDLYRDYGRTLARHWTLAHLLEPPVVDQALTEMAYQEQSGRIVVRRLSTGEQLASFTVPAQIEGIKSGFAFTPDGRRLVVVTEGGQSDNGHVEDWQIATGSLVGSLCAARSTCS